MPTIYRLWKVYGSDSESQLEMLCKRPRVDYRISEYVFEYIKTTLMRPHENYLAGYAIDFSFLHYHKGEQIKDYPGYENSVYNTENTKYGSRITNESGYITTHLYIGSNEIDENIKPREYANFLHNMIGSNLIKRYKRITKEIMDKNKQEMNYTYIEKYAYPAAFDDQKYYEDRYSINGTCADGKHVYIVKEQIEEYYIKHFGR